MRYLIPFFVLLLLPACALQPTAEREEIPPLTLSAARENPDAVLGQQIKWGGTIVSATNLPQQTRLEIVSRPLDYRGRPRQIDTTEGRFLAIVDGFLDPVVYAKGREITVEGVIEGVEDGRIGDYPYRFIVVQAASHRLWKKRRPVNVRYVPDPLYYWHHDRWGHPYSPYWW
jgi:outer membrane lipoprotein